MNTWTFLTGESAALFWPPIIAGLAVAAMCAFLSVLVVLKRLSFIGQGISHAAFGGIGVAAMLGLLSGTGAGNGLSLGQFCVVLTFCLASAILIGHLSRKSTTHADTAIGIILVASMALGAILLKWNSVPTATGYAAWAMGGMERAGQGGDLVMWTSANSKDGGTGMDWLSPAEVQRQIAAKNILPPTQTTCSIPAEAKAAAGGMMFGSMNAFGPEENFSFPPKPADPKAVWNIDWTAKVRFRAFASFMTGMGSMGAGGGEEGQPARKPKACKGPLGIPMPGSSC